MSKTIEYYLSDLGKNILFLAQGAQRDAASSSDAFQQGRQLAFYEVLSLMKQQAEAFGMDESLLGLGDTVLEDLLL
jgi:hypothetical protein